jgi:hypothetical protein
MAIFQVLAWDRCFGIREIISNCFYYNFYARPARFERATAWFEVRPEGKVGKFEFYQIDFY